MEHIEYFYDFIDDYFGRRLSDRIEDNLFDLSSKNKKYELLKKERADLINQNKKIKNIISDAIPCAITESESKIIIDILEKELKIMFIEFREIYRLGAENYCRYLEDLNGK